jgi:hypothetical protein
MDPYNRFVRAMTSVVQQLTTVAEDVGQSGRVLRSLASKTAGGVKAFTFEDKVGQAIVSAVELSRAKQASNSPVRNRDVATRFDRAQHRRSTRQERW